MGAPLIQNCKPSQPYPPPPLANFSSSKDFFLKERREREFTSVQKNLTTDYPLSISLGVLSYGTGKGPECGKKRVEFTRGVD
jgi:hypothetical protein